MAITIELPAEIERDLETRWPDLSRKTLEALAIEGYRQGALSTGQVAHILDLSIYETDGFLKEHGASLFDDKAELDEECESGKRLFSR